MNRAKYSKELISSVGGFAKKTFKMTMIMQKEKSKKIFEDAINRELSVTMARVKLKCSYLPSDAIKLILDTAIIMHANNTNTLHMHDLSEFHHLIDKKILMNWVSQILQYTEDRI